MRSGFSWSFFARLSLDAKIVCKCGLRNHQLGLNLLSTINLHLHLVCEFDVTCLSPYTQKIKLVEHTGFER